MYVQRVMFTPALGKAGQLRAALEERVRARQAEGIRASLTQVLFGSTQPLGLVIAAGTLAELAAIRDRAAADLSFQEFQARINALIDRSPDISLIETLSPAQDPPASPSRFVQRILLEAAPGKARELQTALEERVALRRSQGMQCGLSVIAFGSETGLMLRLLFPDAAAVEAFRERNRNDPGFQQFQARLTSLTTGAGKVELSEILIPLQPVAERTLAAVASR